MPGTGTGQLGRQGSGRRSDTPRRTTGPTSPPQFKRFDVAGLGFAPRFPESRAGAKADGGHGLRQSSGWGMLELEKYP